MESEGCGFNEMQRRLDGITATMLSRRLDQLEAEGIVKKSTGPTSPPASTYRLTETGRELAEILREIEKLNPNQEE
jgi:DNA-binding HxlR family transcriptional regulator